VAVIQISRIQVRRGQKNQGTGLPQLASGEFGWAIDTRELYIGNGSVSEGSPAVGNTKLLTEHDNIFSLPATYTYKQASNIQTGVSTVSPVTRTLQDRLDDTISIRSFGVLGESSQDATAGFQRAIDQLFINSSFSGEKSRVTLMLEPGIYTISGTIYLPPYTKIQGAGSERTVIKKTNAGTLFQTVNDSSTPGAPAANSSDTFNTQARHLQLAGFTVMHTAAGVGFDLQNCRNSTFKDIHVIGNWNTGEAIPTVYTNDIGIKLSSLSSAVSSNDNIFEQCKIGNWAFGIVSNYDIEHNLFKENEFIENGHGILFGVDMSLGSAGQVTGPRYTKITNNKFNNISRHGIWLENAIETKTKDNFFSNTGNEGGNESQPTHSIIKSQKATNRFIHDIFTRTENLSYDKNSLGTLASVAYIPEIEGLYYAEFGQLHTISFPASTNPIVLFRLPYVGDQQYKITYLINNANRSITKDGVLTVVAESGSSPMVTLTDDYTFAGDIAHIDAVSFTSTLHDYNSDLTNDTINIQVTSSLASASSIQFKINNHKLA
tara:strand:- start:56 stop:1696 length:1641 start_codon:yes stop_codon:yes gene_type:complete